MEEDEEAVTPQELLNSLVNDEFEELEETELWYDLEDEEDI